MGFGPWGLLVLVLIPLIQIPCLVVLSRYVDWDGDWDGEGYAGQPIGYEAFHVEGSTTGETDGVTCSRCGAENETGYAYCRDCVARLP